MKVENSPSFSQGYQLAHEVPFTQDALGLLRSGIFVRLCTICVRFCSLLYVCNALVVRLLRSLLHSAPARHFLPVPVVARKIPPTSTKTAFSSSLLIRALPLLLRVTQAARRVVLAPVFALHHHVDDPPSETSRAFLLLNPSHFAEEGGGIAGFRN